MPTPNQILNNFLANFPSHLPPNLTIQSYKHSHFTSFYTFHNNLYYPIYSINHFQTISNPYTPHPFTHFNTYHQLLQFFLSL